MVWNDSTMQVPSLAPLIERHWSLKNVHLSLILQSNSTRVTWSIQSDQGSFVVKAYKDDLVLGLGSLSADGIDLRLGIFEYLDERGFGQAPLLLKTRAGDRFIQTGGLSIFILELIEGTRPPSTASTWSQLGELAASLNAFTDYSTPYGIPVGATIAELNRNAERYPFSGDYRKLVSTLEALADQPACLIHGEINTANSVLSSEGSVFLLDWDQAGSGPWALEAGYPLITTFLSEDLVYDSEAATAFYGSWAAGTSISAERREHIFTAALLHALRYLESGDTTRRWKRIQYALANKEELLSAIEGSNS
jgi:hypothetical protein